MKVILNEYENNGYHDSDFFTVLFDRETKQVETVMSGTTRAGMALPEVVKNAVPLKDATETDFAEARQTLKAEFDKTEKRLDEMRIGKTYDHQVGDTVRIVKGRKYPIGTEFVVADISHWRAYGEMQTTYLHDENGEIKTNADNCEIIKNSPNCTHNHLYRYDTPLIRR